MIRRILALKSFNRKQLYPSVSKLVQNRTCFLFPFQKFSRLKTELNIKTSTDNGEALNAEGSHSFSGSSFDPKALNNAYNYADYDDVHEPPGMK